MMIKDLRKPDNYFGDIKPGTVFAIKDSFYMTIEPIEDMTQGIPLNAVNLETGELTHYFDTTAIQIVKAQLCVWQ